MMKTDRLQEAIGLFFLNRFRRENSGKVIPGYAIIDREKEIDKLCLKYYLCAMAENCQKVQNLRRMGF